MLFGGLVSFWRGRALKYGERYVGNVNEDHRLQRARIEALLRQRLNPSVAYEDVLDLGCGWGRFETFWSGLAGHIWAVDVLPDMLEKARTQAPNVTALKASWPFRLPLQDRSISLLWACFVFQDIKEDPLFKAVVGEVSRLLAPQARVLILDTGKARDPKTFGEAFGLGPGWHVGRVTVNSTPRDTWLVDGIRG